jgi:hypothetical protein
MTTYTSEPGTRLGGRYRLEDRIAAGSGWAAWKAIDETLARAVTVFTFAQGFPRVAEVVTAARAASRLTDPRLAQVFDVEDAWDRAYIVMEWAAGETLGDQLAEGPIEPYRAARMMSEAAAALSSAHAAGVAHMCLSPGSVRWSQTGEVKVVGLGIDAALSGVSADDPVLTDTQGLGQLLYAALTGHWPGPDYPPLPPAPVADGQPCSPRQVVAGVPLALSDLACRAMQLRTRDGGMPLAAPEELASALIAVLPPVLPPALPPRHSTMAKDQYPGRPQADTARARWPAGSGEAGWSEESGWSGEAGGPGEAGWPDGARPDDSWQSTGSGRSGPLGRRGFSAGRASRRRPGPAAGLRSRLSAVSIAVVGLLALAAIAAFTLWPRHGGSPPGHHGGHSASPSASVTTLVPAGATGFDPLTPGDSSNENTQYARYAIDANPKTAWVSQWYRSAHFGGLKSGSGLIIDMGKPVSFSTVTVTFGPIAGANVKLLVGSSNERSQANLAAMKTVAARGNVTGAQTFQLSSPVSGRYLVIWFTTLPQAPHSQNQWMAEIFNVAIKGAG